MREPVTPSDVNSELWRLIKRANEVITEIYKAGDEYANSRADYDSEHAKAVLRQTEGTVQEKKAKADVECLTQYKKFLQTEVRYKYLKTVLDTTRDQLSAIQSVAANLRVEAELHKHTQM